MAAKSRSVYLVRHAIAADRGTDWPDDAKRPLTSKGTARMREVVAGLRALDPEITVVLSSPLVRAEQTADVLVEGLKPRPELHVVPALAPGGTPQQVLDAIAEFDGTPGIALVGHEPDLGKLAAWMVGAKTAFAFKKGGVCRIDLPIPASGGSGELVWFATPKMLRALE